MLNKGSLVLLKIFLDDRQEFVTIGGLRMTRFTLNHQLVDCTNKLSGSWRELLEQGGTAYVSVAGSGLATNSDSEKILRHYAFQNLIKPYLIYFGNGDILSGNFQITSYECGGNYNDEETYALTLESSGPISWQNGEQALTNNFTI